MKNKNGFTLIELLAVIVIIGIIGTIAVTFVSQDILKSRDSSFVNLAKVYMESVRTMRSKDNFYYNPKANEAIVIPCSQADETNIRNKNITGYGNVLNNYCYIGVTNVNNNYSYYMTLVDDTYHALIGANYNSVSEDDIVVGTEYLENVSKLNGFLGTFKVKYDNVIYETRAVRMKYSATYNDNGMKTIDLYGYYTNDNSHNSSNLNIKGTIDELDTFLGMENPTITLKGQNYNIINSEIMYLILKKV